MSELDLNKVEENINSLRGKIWEKQVEATEASDHSNDETLSVVLLTIARHNSGLGQNAATAKAIARDMKRVLEDLKKDREIRISELTLLYVEAGQAVGKSEHQAKVNAAKQFKPLIKEAFEVYNEVQLIADQADDMSFRTDTFLKLGQTRVSLLKADKK